jgi:hypothetical protein
VHPVAIEKARVLVGALSGKIRNRDRCGLDAPWVDLRDGVAALLMGLCTVGSVWAIEFACLGARRVTRSWRGFERAFEGAARKPGFNPSVAPGPRGD